ncbi:hypothetical protein HGRIS_005071 [Hohenbuehelia grisea]|uniref:Fungal lipase-type domain-containing protein n=1 Tax=Hohenbuehelia grisea TaxID=104357 RepID=A0ABR3JE39_9AGAR
MAIYARALRFISILLASSLAAIAAPALEPSSATSTSSSAATTSAAVAAPTEPIANVTSPASFPAPTSLDAAYVSSFKPLTYFAGAAYCHPNDTLAWNCGEPCQANEGFISIASGGDGAAVQFWYVGYDPQLKSVVVAHQGTDQNNTEALVTDFNVVLVGLNSTLFPGMPEDIKVHAGFVQTHSLSAFEILAAVKKGLIDHGANHVTAVGHSLGGALALLDSVYLPLHLESIDISTVVYGMPRVGNQAFADYVDSKLQLKRINNRRDPVPILPGIFFGYRHPAGEIRISDTDEWMACDGQDNENTSCSTGAVGSIFDGVIADHSGPYDGVTIRCHSNVPVTGD